MTADPRRQLLAHGLIGLAVCIGGYMAFVDPARTALATARAQARSLESQLKDAEGVRDSLPQLMSSESRVRAEAEAIEQRGAAAREERQLFGVIMAAAAEHHLQIDQLNPAKNIQPRAVATPGQPGIAPDKDACVGYAISATGTYQDVCAFLGTLRTEVGYTLVRGVRITPTPDEGARTVRAVIDTSHFAFDLSVPSPEDAARIAGGPQS